MARLSLEETPPKKKGKEERNSKHAKKVGFMVAQTLPFGFGRPKIWMFSFPSNLVFSACFGFPGKSCSPLVPSRVSTPKMASWFSFCFPQVQAKSTNSQRPRERNLTRGPAPSDFHRFRLLRSAQKVALRDVETAMLPFAELGRLQESSRLGIRDGQRECGGSVVWVGTLW